VVVPVRVVFDTVPPSTSNLPEASHRDRAARGKRTSSRWLIDPGPHQHRQRVEHRRKARLALGNVSLLLRVPALQPVDLLPHVGIHTGHLLTVAEL